jgi:type II secretory pathway pseudopilin PulG
LVVITIIAILAALLSPVIASLKSKGNISPSLSNLRQIGIALTVYCADGDGCLPPQKDPATGLDWSGQLVVAKLLAPKMLLAPEDRLYRRPLGAPTDIGGLYRRSYGINSSKWTFLGNGYQSPWPKDISAKGAKLFTVPPTILLAGENFGGGTGAGAYVGVTECEGLDGTPRDLYPKAGHGACYLRADGSGFFASKTDMSKYRADTDYAGNRADPWKWKP